jgi:ribonuclease Z
MRRTIGAVMALVVSGSIAAVISLGLAACGPIALRVTRAGVERALTADPIADLPDGLHVALCGAGGPMPSENRSGPCVAVVAGRTLFVVDAGTNGARNLQRTIGWAPGRIAAVFLTHYHSDHIDGLGELGLLRWVGGGHHDRLPLYGPEGLADVAAGFERAYQFDARYRVAHHGPEVVPPEGAGFETHPFVTPDAGAALVLWEHEGIRVSAFRVEHEPVFPAVGYRFDYGGRSLVVSGDTRKSQSLLAQARGVDLIVHEALSPKLVGVLHDAAESAHATGLAKITTDILTYHTTPVEAAEVAQEAGARHLLLYHIVPPLPVPGLEGVFLEGVSDAFSGGVTLGRDGTRISLPSGSHAVDVTQP